MAHDDLNLVDVADVLRLQTCRSVTFHSLLHTFVSLLKVTGSSQSVAKELAGHSSDQVNLNVSGGAPLTSGVRRRSAPSLSRRKSK